jgi:hypothetical protein
MPVKGLKEVRVQLKKIFGDIKGPKAEKTLTEVLITAAGFAATMTPIDTSNLINSQYRKITAYGTRVVGAIGYTAAYAAAVHDKKGTLQGKNVPRDKNDPSRGNVWDPDAEPGFLKKAFEDSDARAAIDAIVKRGMTI